MQAVPAFAYIILLLIMSPCRYVCVYQLLACLGCLSEMECVLIVLFYTVCSIQNEVEFVSIMLFSTEPFSKTTLLVLLVRPRLASHPFISSNTYFT